MSGLGIGSSGRHLSPREAPAQSHSRDIECAVNPRRSTPVHCFENIPSAPSPVRQPTDTLCPYGAVRVPQLLLDTGVLAILMPKRTPKGAT